MKKTIDISLAGILFHVEEDAYYKLKKYLKSVRNSLGNTPDADEVMNEIEARIAELLLEKQAHPQQVINFQNVDEIIGIMGQPEDYEEEAEPVNNTYAKVKKSLFRDFDNSVIGGVAAGLAHYIGMDITLMRLLFVILFFATHGSFILIYLLLWIVVPKAKTASDKLKMKGESVNVDNITEQVSAEESHKKKIKIAEKVEDTTHEFGNVIIKIIGLLLAFISGVLLLGLILSAASLLPFANMNLMIDQMPVFQDLNISFGWVSAMLLILIGFPVALLFLLGIKMLFPNTKSLNKNVFIVGGTIWLLSLAVLVAKTSALMTYKNTDTKLVSVRKNWDIASDTLFLSTQNFMDTYNDDIITDNRIYYKFYPSEDEKFQLIVEKVAEGKNQINARKNARNIAYEYRFDSIQNKLVFNDLISYPNDNFIVERKLYVKIYIPKGKYLKIMENYTGMGDFSRCQPPFILRNQDGKILCDGKKYTYRNKEEVININGNKVRLKIGDKGVDIYSTDDKNKVARIKIDEHGVVIKAHDNRDSVGVEINENGIKIKNTKNEK